MLCEKKKVAIYCRVARADENALEHQMRTALRFAVDSGCGEYRIYLDNGLSGATVDRPAFNRLNCDMLAGEIQTVVVKDLSRIARNFILVDRWMSMADALGVKVISTDDDIAGGADVDILLLRWWYNQL